jgi:carotenoid 1,2-hydratase
LIAFVGSVFSPYYAAARRRGTTDPENYCALNVALYGRRERWAMTERGRRAMHRDASTFVIGPSALAWDGNALMIDINEIGAPIPRRIAGRVRVIPQAVTRHEFVLDSFGEHRWRPIAPRARVEVELSHPALRWSGEGYLDSNTGDVPLERSFVRWDWSRAALRDGTAVLYDVTCRDGTTPSLALMFDMHGDVQDIVRPPPVTLPPNGWRVPRATRSDDAARVIDTLENAPFYARSLIATRLCGEDTIAVHESLSLDRFANRIVQLMLPFRMPRALR